MQRNKAWRHFKTITGHKILVMENCFRVGLFRQGLMHDLSKYSPVEFGTGVKYYQGNRSPNAAEREEKGYSEAWLHHKGRNRHHYEYWIDYSMKPGEGMIGLEMPVNYVVEMFLDRIAASKIYERDAYTDRSPLRYYERGAAEMMIHPKTRKLLRHLLEMLAEKGERKTLSYIRNTILKYNH